MKYLLIFLMISNIFALNLDSLKSSAESGDIYANVILGEKYLYGESGVEKDYDKALDLLSETLPHPVSTYHVACCYGNGWGTEIDVKKSQQLFKEFREAAIKEENKDIPDIFAHLGDCFLSGAGGVKSIKKAFYYTNLSSNRGDAFGQYQLANYYIRGLWVDFDLEKAKTLYRKSADQGFESAQTALGEGPNGKLCTQLVFITKDKNTLEVGNGEVILNGIDLSSKCTMPSHGIVSNMTRKMVFQKFKCSDWTLSAANRANTVRFVSDELKRVLDSGDSKDFLNFMKASTSVGDKVLIIQSIKDKDLLLKIYNKDKYLRDKSFNRKRRSNQMLKNVLSWKLKYITSIERKDDSIDNDQDSLRNIAMSPLDEDLKLHDSAIEGITNQDYLKKIYENRQLPMNSRLYALSFITDQKYLSDVALGCIRGTEWYTGSNYYNKAYATTIFNISDTLILKELSGKKKSVDPHGFTDLLLAEDYDKIYHIIRKAHSPIKNDLQYKDIVKSHYVSNAIFRRLRFAQNVLGDIVRYKVVDENKLAKAIGYIEHDFVLEEFSHKLDTSYPVVYYQSKIMLDRMKAN